MMYNLNQFGLNFSYIKVVLFWVPGGTNTALVTT